MGLPDPDKRDKLLALKIRISALTKFSALEPQKLLTY